MFETRGVVGYEFVTFEHTTLTPFVGFGYRRLTNELGSVEGGYDRESNYFYSPIGIESNSALGNGWFLGLTMEYDVFWKGTQNSNMSDLAFGYSDLEHEQKDGYGLRASMKFHNSKFIIEPFIKYWNIDDSEYEVLTYYDYPVGMTLEPENTSTEFGLILSYRF